MRRRSWAALCVAFAALASACGEPAQASAPRAGGAATVFDTTRDAFGLPAPGLTKEHRAQFFVGNSFFNQNWVTAPASVPERDGLGPLFNARSCSTCHFKDGRGTPPAPGEPLRSMLVRISVPGRGDHGAPLGDLVYGDQLQGESVAGVPPEAKVELRYEELPGRYADGEPYSLRRPTYAFADLGYGSHASGLLKSPRVAPALIGLGLLEAVPEAALRALSDPSDRDGDGISGRTNRVWDRTRGRPALGRFGWKAEQPSVRQQTAGAFLGDMGLTSGLFPGENHTQAQLAAQGQPSGGEPEVSERVLESVVLYARALAVPARRDVGDPQVAHGEALFEQARCSGCHTVSLETAAPEGLAELGAQRIHPYSDLLLHDMGEGLADGRPTFEADGREWRTAPLWGLGLVGKVNGHTTLLHDGRARNFAEAVLWHGGEAKAARDAFAAMSRTERAALIAFLQSL